MDLQANKDKAEALRDLKRKVEELEREEEEERIASLAKEFADHELSRPSIKVSKDCLDFFTSKDTHIRITSEQDLTRMMDNKLQVVSPHVIMSITHTHESSDEPIEIRLKTTNNLSGAFFHVSYTDEGEERIKKAKLGEITQHENPIRFSPLGMFKNWCNLYWMLLRLFLFDSQHKRLFVGNGIGVKAVMMQDYKNIVSWLDHETWLDEMWR